MANIHPKGTILGNAEKGNLAKIYKIKLIPVGGNPWNFGKSIVTVKFYTLSINTFFCREIWLKLIT